MRTERIDEILLVRYLLGDLPEAEQVQVEDRAFADADYMSALEAAEADLIDDYVRGGLSQSERRAFEQRFLTSASRWRKVEFAKALAKIAAETPRPERAAAKQTLMGLFQGWSPSLRFATALAFMILVAAPSWLIFQNAAMRSHIAVLERQGRESEKQDQALRQRLADAQSAAARESAKVSPVVASLVLLPGLSRGERRVEQLTLAPPAQIAHLEIQLESRDDYPRFRAELRTRSGEQILTRDNLSRRRTSAGFAVSFDVPASALAAGEYEISLKGAAEHETATDIGYYYFGVRKQ